MEIKYCMKRLIYFTLIIFAFSSCDKEKNYLRDGNENFEEKQYVKAEDNYLKALAIDSTYKKAQFNLANSNYKKDKDDQLNKALIYYDKALSHDSIIDTNFLADLYYNRGNTNFRLALLDSIQKDEKYNKGLEKAILDYKNTLKINSEDSAAKYNLSLAMRLLNQNKNNNQNKNKKDKKEQENQEKQKQENKQNKKENQEQDNKNQEYQKKQNQDKERMLEALKNNEKNTLERLKKEKDKNAKQNRNDKDW